MKINNLTVQFGTKTVFKDFSIEIPSNIVTCILGPSGCGKTTLLNSIAGTIPFSGSIEKSSDKIAYIFQTPVALSHLTVKKNLDFVLKKPFPNKQDRQRRIEDALRSVELYEEKDSYPPTLSGGMAQRLELARAYAYQPEILLMDEPFRGLDVSLKKNMIELFQKLFIKQPITTIMVTHDIDEAILLADSIYILGHNKIIYSIDLPHRDKKEINDFPEIRDTLYKLL